MKFTWKTLGQLLAFGLSASAQLNNITTPFLNLTVIAANDVGSSILQCWSLPGITTSGTAGTNGALALFLGELANATYTVIPPRFDGGLHNAPSAQLVWVVSGLIHVTLPNVTMDANSEVWVQGGKYGLVLAVDTADVSKYGHISTYPSDADSVILQAPFKKGKVPDHKVLYEGPCAWKDMVGI